MTWVGLERYGYLEDAQRLAYRWVYMYVPLPLTIAMHNEVLQDDNGFRRF
jgi:neutral trehalase